MCPGNHKQLCLASVENREGVERGNTGNVNWVTEGLGYWVKEFGLIFDNEKPF